MDPNTIRQASKMIPTNRPDRKALAIYFKKPGAVKEASQLIKQSNNTNLRVPTEIISKNGLLIYEYEPSFRLCPQKMLPIRK